MSRARTATAFIAAAALAALLVGANLLAARGLEGVQIDVTRERLHTLSPGARQVLAALREPVTLRFYYSPILGATAPGYGAYAERVRDLLGEFSRAAGGRLRVESFDPEPFSDVEDRAIALGLRGVPLDATGSSAYFGLAGSNSVDDERTLPFLDPARERFLEYDLARLVHDLSDPRRPAVGVLSGLPLDGTAPAPDGTPGAPPWVAMTQLRQAFAVSRVPTDAGTIPAEVQVLVVVHPQALPTATLYAIDQFVMRGGRLLVFVDPHSEVQAAASEAGGAASATGSDLQPLLAAWGLSFDPGHVVGDPDGAWRVRATDDPRAAPIDYLPWFTLRGDAIAAGDPATGDLDQVTLAAAGALAVTPNPPAAVEPLLRAGPRAGLIDTSAVMGDPDPPAILAGFRPGSAAGAVLAARLRGVLPSAFAAPPSGTGAAPAAHLRQSDGPANVVVVADSDVLVDRFWVRMARGAAGVTEPVPFSDNGAFVVNLTGTLAGGDALLGLRARGGGLRPLERIDAIRRAAEVRYQQTEQTLRGHLDAARARLDALRAGREGAVGPAGRAIITAEQQRAIDDLTRDVADTRGQLRRVRLDLQRDVERLERTVRLLNVLLVPALVILASLLASVVRRRRRRPLPA